MMVFQREPSGHEVASLEVMSGDKRQRLSVVLKDEAALVLFESGAKLRSWPLQLVKLVTDQPGGVMTVEVGGETMTWTCLDDEGIRREFAKTAAAFHVDNSEPLASAALGALLEDTAPEDADAELWVKRLAERLAKLDALNVAGMLNAHTEGGGAQLAERLEAGVKAGNLLSARLAQYEGITKACLTNTSARSGAARADANARALLQELTAIYQWLDAPALGDLDALSQISLATPEGREKALQACEALRTALGAESAMPLARRKLAAVRERLRRLHRAKDQLSAALARHLNNALIHLGNEASHEKQRHATLLQYAPHMRCVRHMDSKAYQALQKVYVSTWSRVYERDIKTACDQAKAQIEAGKGDSALQQVLDFVEDLCNREQDFCTQFFHLDLDMKSEGSDGERSEKSEGGDRAESARRASETKKLLNELFPTMETELLGLVATMERHDPYGAMRALACAGRRVLGPDTPGTPTTAATVSTELRCSRAALAAVAVAAKRGADRIVADRIASFPDYIKQAAKRQKCGVLGFIAEFEEMARECEVIFAASTRRADLERWYLSLATGMLRSIANAEHPRTPRALLHTENYHALYGVLSSLRVAALEGVRRECRTRYNDSLVQYVTRQLGRPLEKLTQFFEGVAEAVAAGVREEEVCYRAAFSKHELKRVLSLYPAHEVRKSLHRLYRTVEKQLSEEGGLLQVVWRAMQEDFIAQHTALSTRIAACYPGSGLSMPLTTQHILEAFSDIVFIFQTRIAACYPGSGLSMPLTTQHILEAFSDIVFIFQTRIAACYPGSGLSMPLTTQHILEAFSEIVFIFQTRIAACYPGSGLSMPLTTQHILEAFSDIVFIFQTRIAACYPGSGLSMPLTTQHILEAFSDIVFIFQTRIAACYPGSGLSMPLTTQHILEAFSDIAKEH